MLKWSRHLLNSDSTYKDFLQCVAWPFDGLECCLGDKFLCNQQAVQSISRKKERIMKGKQLVQFSGIGAMSNWIHGDKRTFSRKPLCKKHSPFWGGHGSRGVWQLICQISRAKHGKTTLPPFEGCTHALRMNELEKKTPESLKLLVVT